MITKKLINYLKKNQLCHQSQGLNLGQQRKVLAHQNLKLSLVLPERRLNNGKIISKRKNVYKLLSLKLMLIDKELVSKILAAPFSKSPLKVVRLRQIKVILVLFLKTLEDLGHVRSPQQLLKKTQVRQDDKFLKPSTTSISQTKPRRLHMTKEQRCLSLKSSIQLQETHYLQIEIHETFKMVRLSNINFQTKKS